MSSITQAASFAARTTVKQALEAAGLVKQLAVEAAARADKIELSEGWRLNMESGHWFKEIHNDPSGDANQVKKDVGQSVSDGRTGRRLDSASESRISRRGDKVSTPQSQEALPIPD